MNSRPVIERIAGVMVPLFSLRSRADAGIGDIAALDAMTDLAAAMGHRAVLLLPIDETSPGESSPYSALSLFAIDPVYIGLDGLEGVEQPQLEDVRHALARVPLSERLTIRAARIALLEAAFDHFVAHGDGREAVADFTARHRDWLDDYALFRALKDHFDFVAWEQWPDELRRREPDALARAKAARAEKARAGTDATARAAPVPVSGVSRRLAQCPFTTPLRRSRRPSDALESAWCGYPAPAPAPSPPPSCAFRPITNGVRGLRRWRGWWIGKIVRWTMPWFRSFRGRAPTQPRTSWKFPATARR